MPTPPAKREGLPIADGNAFDAWIAITLSATPNITPRCRGVICLTAGNAVLVDEIGNSITVAMTAGQILDVNPVRLDTTSTGTYAALY